MDQSNLVPPAWKNRAHFPEAYMECCMDHGQIRPEEYVLSSLHHNTVSRGRLRRWLLPALLIVELNNFSALQTWEPQFPNWMIQTKQPS